MLLLMQGLEEFVLAGVSKIGSGTGHHLNVIIVWLDVVTMEDVAMMDDFLLVEVAGIVAALVVVVITGVAVARVTALSRHLIAALSISLMSGS
jgi:hypothetical protein